MAIKDILFHVDTRESGRGVGAFACALADALDAHLTGAGLAIQYAPYSSLEDPRVYEYFAEATDDSRAAAQAAFEAVAASAPANVKTELVMIEAPAAIARERFGELGRHFDLSIVGQSSPPGDDEQLMIEGALYGSGQPVFVTPFKTAAPIKFENAMVCWDGGIAAARAIAGALPLLRLAKRIEVVRVADGGAPTKELPGFNITRHLARHGLVATLKSLPPASDPGAAILGYAAESGADYIVMGGYGHWQLREFILGGATRTVLAGLNRPALMAH